MASKCSSSGKLSYASSHCSRKGAICPISLEVCPFLYLIFNCLLPKQISMFFNSFIRERANKRKLQEKVRAFSLVCRGLVNEYGEQQPSPFF